MSSNPVPMRMSNEEFMAGGGLYPGGTGIVKKFSFELWDYDGNMPKDSVVAAAMLFQPTDGSNEGKELMIHWSVGNSTDYVPDGQANNGFVCALKGQQKLGDGSNYAFFLKKLAETCGMPVGKLSGDQGVHSLEGSVLTLARVDQPKREGLADAKPADGKQTRPRQTYIPTRAQWGWDTGAQTAAPAMAGGRTAPRGSRAQAAALAAQAPAPTPAPQAAPPANGNGAGSITAASIIESILTAGPANVTDLPRLGLEWMTANTQLDRKQRMPLATELKDAAAIEEMALVNDWKLEGGVLSIPA